MNDKAIVPIDQAGDTRMITISELERMALAVFNSGLFGMKTVDQALSLMLIAQAEGLHPALAARDYDIIQGKPALKSKAKMARFQRVGGIVKWITRTDISASAEFSHPSSPTPIVVEWNIDMAQRAGLAGKDNWKKHPRQMLSARVISEGVDATYPDAGSLMYVPEEIEDFAGSRIPPSPTGLFDRPTQPEATVAESTPPQLQPAQTDKNESAQPAQQTLPLTAPPAVQSTSPKKPAELSTQEMMDEIIEKFKGFNSVSVDTFFKKKGWLKPDEALPELESAQIKRLFKNIDQTITIFKAWEKQQESLAKNTVGPV